MIPEKGEPCSGLAANKWRLVMAGMGEGHEYPGLLLPCISDLLWPMNCKQRWHVSLVGRSFKSQCHPSLPLFLSLFLSPSVSLPFSISPSLFTTMNVEAFVKWDFLSPMLDI